jgi:hypothetical protein
MPCRHFTLISLVYLAWTIKEILSDGDKVIVRSHATGTPSGHSE